MSVVRQQGRPKRGATVGRERVVSDTLNLLRRGETFGNRKELATKIGITPALINYYFGRKCDITYEHIVCLIETYAEQLRKSIARHEGRCRHTLADVLPFISEMYIKDGPLLVRYSEFVAAGLKDCAIARMKRDLTSVVINLCEESEFDRHQADTMAAMIWAACSGARGESCVVTCAALVDRMVDDRRKNVGENSTHLSYKDLIAAYFAASGTIGVCRCKQVGTAMPEQAYITVSDTPGAVAL